MALHSSTLAWRIPGTGEPGRLQFMVRSQSDTTEATEHTYSHKGQKLPVSAKLPKASK